MVWADVKLSNFLLFENNTVRASDFGLMCAIATQNDGNQNVSKNDMMLEACQQSAKRFVDGMEGNELYPPEMKQIIVN